MLTRIVALTLVFSVAAASCWALPLARGAAGSQEEALAKRPKPYSSREVTFGNERGSVTLAGTLSVPDGRGPFPAVVLIGAAGPTDRDENAAGHLVFVVLADHLLRERVAVLRYDKRGVGRSSGDFDTASFADLVADASAAFRYLSSQPEVDRRRVGVVGHSEGGSIGPAVAVANEDVAFIVAMAGSGLNGEFRVTEHEAYVAREGGASAAQERKIRELCHQVFRAVAETGDDSAAGARIAQLIDGAVGAGVWSASQAVEARRFLTPKLVRVELHDEPLSYLKKVRVPVLALVGSLDRIVPAGPYVEAMRPVLETIPGSKVVVLPGLNHLMQTAQTGSPREFASIKESISPVALQTIGDWVAVQTRRAR